MFAQNLFIQLGIPATFAGDAALVLGAIIFSVAFGFFMGRSRLSNYLINVYVAKAIALAIPHDALASLSLKNAEAVVFLVLVLFLNIVAFHLFDIHIPGSASTIVGRMFFLSFLEVGLTLSTLVSFFPAAKAYQYISHNAYFIFASPYAQLTWLVVPLVFLFIINRKYS